jgi:hypothetical protein
MRNVIVWPALFVLAVLTLPACEPIGPTIAEAQYATALVGKWQGVVGNQSETMSFQADGSFTATLVPQGFISGTLSEGTTGNIFGRWTLQGNVITLTIDSAENEQPLNLATTSTILAFNQNKLVVSSGSEQPSAFSRVE